MTEETTTVRMQAPIHQGSRAGAVQANGDVFAIRHGETAWSLSGQHTGTTDIPLTDNGRRLAERMRPVLARQKYALVLVSPLRRARETCDLAGLGNVATVEPDLAEWDTASTKA